MSRFGTNAAHLFNPLGLSKSPATDSGERCQRSLEPAQNLESRHRADDAFHFSSATLFLFQLSEQVRQLGLCLGDLPAGLLHAGVDQIFSYISFKQFVAFGVNRFQSDFFIDQSLDPFDNPGDWRWHNGPFVRSFGRSRRLAGGESGIRRTYPGRLCRQCRPAIGYALPCRGNGLLPVACCKLKTRRADPRSEPRFKLSGRNRFPGSVDTFQALA